MLTTYLMFYKPFLNLPALTSLSLNNVPHSGGYRQIGGLDASEETLRHFGRPQMYPAPAQSIRQQLGPAWGRRGHRPWEEISGDTGETFKGPFKDCPPPKKIIARHRCFKDIKP